MKKFARKLWHLLPVVQRYHAELKKLREGLITEREQKYGHAFMYNNLLERVTSTNFCANNYLRANPDVKNDIQNNLYASAEEHYISNSHEARYQYKALINSDLLTRVDAELIDLCEKNKQYKNIYAEPHFLNSVKIGLTSQFQENAGQYHIKYYNPALSIYYIKTALNAIQKTYKNPDIFDFGSGSGNSVFAAIEIFGECNILASDLSVELLCILNKIKDEIYPNANIKCIAMDILQTKIKKDSFDLFIGTAILHHIIEPDNIFRAAYTALRKGGCLIMVEPMSGYNILGAVYKVILDTDNYVNEIQRLSPGLRNALEMLSLDYLVRGRIYDEMIHCKITDLDDKWLYSTKHITEMATAVGFASVKIIDLGNKPRYKNELEGVLPLLNIDLNTIPEWVYNILSNFDIYDIQPQYNDVYFASAIVCEK
jgi:SAM-dependent methyltransferase